MIHLLPTNGQRWERRRTSTDRSAVAWSSPPNEWTHLRTVRFETILSNICSHSLCCCVWVYLCDEEGLEVCGAGLTTCRSHQALRISWNECECEIQAKNHQIKGSHTTIIFRYTNSWVCYILIEICGLRSAKNKQDRRCSPVYLHWCGMGFHS